MSVYTTLDRETLIDYLKPFAVGELVSFRGIEEGVENTNYFITAAPERAGYDANDNNEYVLTLFEYLNIDELAFFVTLQSHMARHGLPVANPVTDVDGIALKIVAEKPALLFPRLAGGHPDVINKAHCAAMGDMMARLHSLPPINIHRENHRGLEWLQYECARLKSFLSNDDQNLMQSELDDFETFLKSDDALSSGIIHADLFRDNALFSGDTLNGVIDFYNACDGLFLYDLAIMANDWCVKEDGSFDNDRLNAMLTSYARTRPFASAERTAWQPLLRAAALRFWVSRLVSMHLPEDLHKRGALTQLKDPEEFKQILKNRIAVTHRLP